MFVGLAGDQYFQGSPLEALRCQDPDNQSPIEVSKLAQEASFPPENKIN
jgi:hypothetical protein